MKIVLSPETQAVNQTICHSSALMQAQVRLESKSRTAQELSWRPVNPAQNHETEFSRRGKPQHPEPSRARENCECSTRSVSKLERDCRRTVRANARGGGGDSAFHWTRQRRAGTEDAAACQCVNRNNREFDGGPTQQVAHWFVLQNRPIGRPGCRCCNS